MNETFFFFLGAIVCYAFVRLKDRIERGNPKNDRVLDFFVFQSLIGGFIAFWAYVYYFAKGLFK